MSEHLRELIKVYQKARVECVSDVGRRRIEEVLAMLFKELEVCDGEQRRIDKYKGIKY